MIKIIARTIFCYLLAGIIFIIFIIPGGLCLLMPKKWLHKSRIFYGLFYATNWALLKAALVPVTIKGREHMVHEPAIIAANHQSSLDIPLVTMVLGCAPHIWLVKKELMDNFVLRFILPRLAILIDMSTPMAGMRSLVQALDTFYDSPCHAVIFPEGGRYPIDGQIHDFYAGFAILAKKTGRPVVPVRIFNAYKVYPPETFLVHWAPITVIVGEPFRMNEGETEQDFVARVRAWFIAQKED